MRMAKDAEVRLGFLNKCSSVLRQLPAFIQHMTDGDAAARQFDHDLGRKSALFRIIDVAGDGGYGSDGSKLLDDGEPADIAGAKR